MKSKLLHRLAHRSRDIMFAAPFDRFWRRRLLGKIMCLLYHRVDQPGRVPFLDRFGPSPITPDALSSELEFLRRQGARFMSFADLRRGQFPESSEFGVIVSFDDGFRDNYTQGMPALEALGIRGVLFQATAMVDAQTLIWEHALYWYWHDARLQSVFTDIVHRRHPELRLLRGTELLVQLREMLPMRQVEALLGEMLACSGSAAELAQQARALYPKAEDLRRAHAAGHELGSHGHHHYPRKSVDATVFVAELRQSLRLLEKLLGQSPQVFSYPFNSHLPGDAELGRPHVQQMVSVDGAMIDAATAPLALPRFTWPGPHRNALRRRRWLWTGGI